MRTGEEVGMKRNEHGRVVVLVQTLTACLARLQVAEKVPEDNNPETHLQTLSCSSKFESQM